MTPCAFLRFLAVGSGGGGGREDLNGASACQYALSMPVGLWLEASASERSDVRPQLELSRASASCPTSRALGVPEHPKENHGRAETLPHD